MAYSIEKMSVRSLTVLAREDPVRILQPHLFLCTRADVLWSTHVLWIESVGAIRANTMGELGLRVFTDVALQLPPTF